MSLIYQCWSLSKRLDISRAPEVAWETSWQQWSLPTGVTVNHGWLMGTHTYRNRLWLILKVIAVILSPHPGRYLGTQDVWGAEWICHWQLIVSNLWSCGDDKLITWHTPMNYICSCVLIYALVYTYVYVWHWWIIFLKSHVHNTMLI